MSYLDNIKALATELANMAPKTQMELIKLCKDLCINTKNYLVAFDETTLPALDARIEALETLTNNLSSELDTAESNIQANANAISTIQDAISTIQTALSNVYTKSQIDTMLASYYTKSQIDTMFASYYTKTEVDNALSGKADKATTYTKTEVDNALSDKASLNANNTFTGTNNFSGGSRSVRLEAPSDLYFSDSEKDFEDYMGEKQDKLYEYMGIFDSTYDEAGYSGSFRFYYHFTTHNNLTNASDIFNYLKTHYNNTIFDVRYCGLEENNKYYFALQFKTNEDKIYLYYEDPYYDYAMDEINISKVSNINLISSAKTPL